MSDFAVSNYVSIGLHGRADELIYEATVKDEKSPLHNSRVVLRELTSVHAQRRGRRALEVLKKLARRQIMYHSYAMQVHGYVSPLSSENGSFMLVHMYHGSYSLRHWLQLSNWLPTLEATLALDEEWARRVGDDTIGGSAVTRQLRVNYLHSHGLAHTELKLENIHISPVDKHVKVSWWWDCIALPDDVNNCDELSSRMEIRGMAFDDNLMKACAEHLATIRESNGDDEVELSKDTVDTIFESLVVPNAKKRFYPVGNLELPSYSQRSQSQREQRRRGEDLQKTIDEMRQELENERTERLRIEEERHIERIERQRLEEEQAKLAQQQKDDRDNFQA